MIVLGSADLLFDTIDEWQPLTNVGGLPALLNWKQDHVVDFVHRCRTLLPYTYRYSHTPFSFVSSTSLRGGKWPCSNLECRLERVDNLSRFAALYADQVLIPDPFSGFDEASESRWSRYLLLGDLMALIELKPLIKAGIVGIAPLVLPFCDTHEQQYSRSQAATEERLRRATEILKTVYLREAEFKPGMLRGEPFLRITGPDRLVEHGEVNINNLPQNLALRIYRNPGLRLKRMDAERVLESNFIDPLLDDILRQNWISLAFETRYLTDRPIDFEILTAIEQPEKRRQSASLAKALSHSVPVILTIPPEEIVDLRLKEGEAFQLYRDAMHALLNSVDATDDKSVREAVSDLLRPQLNKIDFAVSEAKKTVSNSLREKLVFGTGLVSISLFSGLLPPDVATVVGWLGGAKFATDLLVDANKLVQEPRTIRGNDFYFLWRLNRKAPRR